MPETFYKESKVYYRESPDGLYSGYYEGGAGSAFTQYLQLPAKLEPGTSWKGAPEFWDHEALEKIGPFSSPAGDFAQCLFTVRSSTRQELAQKLYSESVNCPQVGGVRTIIKTSMEGFESTTEMLLIDVQ